MSQSDEYWKNEFHKANETFCKILGTHKNAIRAIETYEARWRGPFHEAVLGLVLSKLINQITELEARIEELEADDS